ncbi:hypothetical protein NDU88_000226 [Pleurodeles waltl]|uniref:Uncharacterized protein n=1 Tax=Pleurodeles waltl TaxID=8319 RepID=A0AAV7UTF7_PLEWA|nr:hypothetical protein NDU88_000226 [Pleurodeles waltl]
MLLVIETAQATVIIEKQETEELEKFLRENMALENAKKCLEELNYEVEGYRGYLINNKSVKLSKDINRFNYELIYTYLQEDYYEKKKDTGQEGTLRGRWPVRRGVRKHVTFSDTSGSGSEEEDHSHGEKDNSDMGEYNKSKHVLEIRSRPGPRDGGTERRAHHRRTNFNRNSENQESEILEVDKAPIINLSQKVLTNKEIEVWERGLSYVPTGRVNKLKLQRDLRAFFRRIRFHKCFEDREFNRDRNKISGLKPKATFTPSLAQVGKEVELFENMLELDIQRILKDPPHSNYNLKKDQCDSLESLQKDPNIIIKPADKGGGIVIFDISDYERRVEALLSVEEHYQRVLMGRLETLKKEVGKIIDEELKGTSMGATCDPCLACLYVG